jgi:hypothetical protein
MTKQEISKLVNSKYVHQIRAGEKHGFIDITIIEAQGRFFVRQYKFGAKSWRDAYLKDSQGEMKIGDTVIKIDGVVPNDLDAINPKINWAYHKKLPLVYFLMRLTYSRSKHEASTIELIVKR